MLVKYIGHACFKVRDNETGYSVVFDPYSPDSIPGFRSIVDTASEVLCSHEHFDHNHRESLKLEPSDSSPFEISFIDTWHDPQKGALRGPNRIYIIKDTRNGEKLIHYGDIGEVMDDLLTEENMSILKDADVALIPVGGTYTYDADEAIELIKRTTPRITIPMHFSSGAGFFGLTQIGTIEDFLTRAQKAGLKVNIAKVCFYDTEVKDLNDSILALRPQNV